MQWWTTLRMSDVEGMVEEHLGQFPMPGIFGFALLLCFHLHRGYARSTYEQDLHHLFPTKMRQKTFPVTI